MTAPDQLRSKAAGLMPQLLTDLERLVAIPSVAFPGYPPEPVHQMANQTLRLFREAGVANAALQEVPTGFPPVYGQLPGPTDATDQHPDREEVLELTASSPGAYRRSPATPPNAT